MSTTDILQALLAKHRQRVADCEALVLLAIAEQGSKARRSEIRDRLKIHDNTISVCLYRLRERGELMRRREKNRRSVVWYSLTPDGRRLVKQLTHQTNGSET